VDLGHKRASGVDHFKATAFAALAYRRRNPVRRINYTVTVWYVVNLMNKNRPFFRQLIHNIAVMDDLATNIDRRAKCLKRYLDDVDGAHHTGAEAARFEQKNPLLTGRCFAMGAIGDRIKRSCSHPAIISICQEFTRVRAIRTRVVSYAFCWACAFTFCEMEVSF